MRIFRKVEEYMKFAKVLKAVEKMLAKYWIEDYWTVELRHSSYSPHLNDPVTKELKWVIYSGKGDIGFSKAPTAELALWLFETKIRKEIGWK